MCPGPLLFVHKDTGWGTLPTAPPLHPFPCCAPAPAAPRITDAREKHHLFASCTCPDWGLNLQPFGSRRMLQPTGQPGQASSRILPRVFA